MWIGVVTLFPEMFEAIMSHGVTGRAIKRGLLNINFWNPRNFTHDRHRTVDDRPYGGGPGMLMMVQPLQDAISAAKKKAAHGVKVIYFTPQGKKIDQTLIYKIAQDRTPLILMCGRYEGVDERIIETEIDQELSIGDYVLTGGELPGMVLIDAISRFIPGVLNDARSPLDDSFICGTLECPHYTRPEVLQNRAVPSVLLSGNHRKIAQWKLKQSLGRTWLRRPELLEKLALTDEQKKLLQEFQHEYQWQEKAVDPEI